MGHLLFLIIHIVCLVAFIPALIVTVPLHIIYAVLHKGRKSTADADDLKKCPDCAEMIKIDAKVCRHCGRRFSPLEIAESLAP